MGDNNIDGDGGGGDGVDGDGSGGTSPSRQGAGIETSIPRISSVAAAELRDFFWKIIERFRVWTSEGLK
jgi:hypothetical protein